jgi:hypothetical protein
MRAFLAEPMLPFFSRIRSWFVHLSKGTRWFILAVILSLIGSGVLVYAVVQAQSLPSASPTQVIAALQTNVALTLAAEPTALPTDTILFPFPSPETDTPAATASPAPIVATSAPVAAGSPCNASQYVSDVTIPDGTQMALGASFVKTWMFENTGTCTWDANYELIYTSGDLMDGTTTKINQTVAPGGQAQVSVSLTAPTTDGTYTGYWRLADDAGNGFGGIVYVQIVASDTIPSATPTDTATPSPTDTATAAPTATTTSLATGIPSATPIASATSTLATTFTSSPTSTLSPSTPTPTSPATNTATSTQAATDTTVPPSATASSNTPTPTATPIPTSPPSATPTVPPTTTQT